MDPRTLADRVAVDLRKDLEAGAFELGVPLPSERELMDRFHAGRETVRRALTALIQEGLLISHRGRGYFVREYSQLDWRPGVYEHPAYRKDIAGSGVDTWGADVRDYGRTALQEVEVKRILRSQEPSVAARLATPDGEDLIVRRRVQSVDGVPWRLADSYYPLDVAQGGQGAIMMAGDQIVPGGLMAAAGFPQARFHDEILARMPSQDEAGRLELPRATPVIEHIRTGFDKDDRPVRVIITIAPGDRNRLLYDVDVRPIAPREDA